MTKQGILFEIDPIPSQQVNTIVKIKSAKLNKEQQVFNRLSKRIENLRKEIVEQSKKSDQCLEFYNSNLLPLETKQVEIDKKVVKPLYELHKKTKLFTAKEKGKLEYIISNKLENIFSNEEPSDELKVIFEEMEGVNYEDIKKEQIDRLKEEMEDMFFSNGMDIDLSDIDFKESPEDVVRKMKELEEKARIQLEEKKSKRIERKKSKKLIEKELKAKQEEDVKKKSLSTIYKQLVKLFHPDLEKDETLKIEKEELMKKVTSAYEKRDLHTLLSLEMQWLKNETENLESVTAEKLEAYIRVLKEQIQELEFEKNSINSHPKYGELEKYSTFFMFPSLRDLREAEEELETKIKMDEQLLESINEVNPEKSIKKILKEFSIPPRVMPFGFPINW